MTQLAKRTGPSRGAWNKATQARVNITSSMLKGMKSIKLTGLSALSASKLLSLRKQELHFSKRFRLLTSLINIVASFPQLVSPVLTFSIYLTQSQEIVTLGEAFSVLTLITLVSSSLYSFTGSLPQITASFGCFDRIQDFLTLEYRASSPGANSMKQENSGAYTEADGSGVAIDMGVYPSTSRQQLETVVALDLSKFSISKSEKLTLRNIDLKVNSGQIVAVTGPVASGKSVLLRACTGELQPSEGSIRIGIDCVGYCAQTPWLRNATVRDNICGQTNFNQSWYLAVITACDLKKDLESMADGDQTMVGSNGLMLSGGQRQRIALARSIYSRNELLVLDSVFSGLDQRTTHLVFSRLFSDTGLLRGNMTTVVFTTNDDNQLLAADWVVMLSHQGEVLRQGSPEHLGLSKDKMQWLASNSEPPTQVEKVGEPNISSSAQVQKKVDDVKDLTRRTGDTSLYWYYAKSIGWKAIIAFLFFNSIYVGTLVLHQAEQKLTKGLLEIWLNYLVASQTKPHQLQVYLGIYGLLAIMGLCAVGLSIGYLFIYLVPRSAQRLHQTLAVTTLNASLSFFYATDAGIVLNRFSQDMSVVDMVLPAALFRFIIAFLNCIASITLAAVGAPYLAAAVPILFGVLYLLQMYYLATSRQLRLLDLEAASPLFTHFSETLEGLATIQAFNWQQSFNTQLIEYLDASQRPRYLLYSLQRWLNVVVNLIVAAVATILVAFALRLEMSTAGAVGVALLSLMGLNEHLALLVLSWTSLETSLGAIARLQQYEKDTPQEAPNSQNFTLLDPEWPREGRLELRDVYASYNASKQPCLRNISLSLPAGAKFAVIGRTGSGKSSLVQAIFRLLELTSGRILIDEVDVSHIPLQTLRSHITAVPQDFLVLPGTVRENIDPMAEFDEEQIHKSLHGVGLWDHISIKGGLDTTMDIMAFSQGQQQMLALTRALLRQSRIVVLDEVTGNIDTETEQNLMHVIAEELKNLTVIAVIHRLHHLRSFDQVVVLDEGQVVMVGSPDEIMQSQIDCVRRLFI